MIRIFLRLYFLVLLPFTIVLLLPQNPISYFGNQLIEERYDREYGSIYGLVNYQLADLPKDQWKAKIKLLQPQFPLGLEIIPINEKQLKDGEMGRLLSKDFILYRKNDFSLIYKIEDSQFALKVGLRDKKYDYDLTEKQTRGIRYLVNEIIMKSDDPVKKFHEINHFFKVPVTIKPSTDFNQKGVIVKSLSNTNMYYQYEQEDPVYIYFSTTDKAYIVTAGPLTNRKKVGRYYNYAQIIFPALLIAIGALLLLYTLLRELKIMNTASRKFGQGQLSTRSKLSKFSTLYSQSNAFNKMASRVEKLLHGHRDLTNAVSHELKTPLSRLRFALQMQQESKSKADQEKYTHKIEDNISELESLINELLSYARLDRNGSLLNLQKHSYADWISKEVQQTKTYQPTLNIQLKIDPSAKISFSFDRSLMDKVIKNLLSNAVRHARKQIFITVNVQQQMAILLVEDDGKGIDSNTDENTNKNALDNLFQPFFRDDESRDRKSGGSGMGLAISKKIIELHGGTIEYQNSRWQGAGFLVKLPLK